MVGLKWLVAISIIVIIFTALIPVEAQQVETRTVGRDATYRITTAERNWLLDIRYITHIKYFLHEGEKLRGLVRPGWKPNIVDSEKKLYPKLRYTEDEVRDLADEAVVAWIDDAEKLIVGVTYDRGFLGMRREPVAPVPPSRRIYPDTRPEPEAEFEMGADFYDTLAEQKTIVYMIMLFVVVVALLIMKLANPMLMVIGICAVTAIFWLMFGSVPLFIPAAMIVFFFVMSIVGGNKWQA